MQPVDTEYPQPRWREDVIAYRRPRRRTFLAVAACVVLALVASVTVAAVVLDRRAEAREAGWTAEQQAQAEEIALAESQPMRVESAQQLGLEQVPNLTLDEVGVEPIPAGTEEVTLFESTERDNSLQEVEPVIERSELGYVDFAFEESVLCPTMVDDVALCFDQADITFEEIPETGGVIGWVDLFASDESDPLVLMARAGEWKCVEISNALTTAFIPIQERVEAANELEPNTVFLWFRQAQPSLCATPAPVGSPGSS